MGSCHLTCQPLSGHYIQCCLKTYHLNGPECDEEMKLVSGSLIDRRLGHYNSEKVLRLATDASPVGVVAVL